MPTAGSGTVVQRQGRGPGTRDERFTRRRGCSRQDLGKILHKSFVYVPEPRKERGEGSESRRNLDVKLPIAI